MIAPHEMLTSAAEMVRARSEATKAATLPPSASAAGLQRDGSDAVGAELAGPLAAKSLHRVERDFEAAQSGAGVRSRSAERQDHPGPARDHVPGGRPGS